MRQRIAVGCFAAILAINISCVAWGQTREWLEPGGGAYGSASLWSGADVPDTAAESARFAQQLAYTVSVNGNYTVGSLLGHGGNVTMAFAPPSGFNPRKTYDTTNLLMDPSLAGGTADLWLTDGDVSASGNTYIGQNTTLGPIATSRLHLLSTQLDSAGATLGRGTWSAGKVEVDDRSLWILSAPLIVGDAGDAEFEIQASARNICNIFGCIAQGTKGGVSSANAILANAAGSDASANIYGNWATGDLTVGNAGRAEITLLGKATQLGTSPFINTYYTGGAMDSSNVSIAALGGSSGRVHLDSSPLFGDWDITGSLAIGGTAGAVGGQGTLDIEFGNDVSVGSNLRMWSTGTLALAKGAIFAVTGNARLAGTLEFSITGGAAPQLNDTYPLLTAGAVLGTFGTTILPPLDPSLAWSLQYAATNVTLKVVAAPSGDYNNDGFVDAADYVVWRTGDGVPSTPEYYNYWRHNFGKVVGGAGSSEAIPEPCGVFLASLGSVVLALRRRCII